MYSTLYFIYSPKLIKKIVSVFAEEYEEGSVEENALKSQEVTKADVKIEKTEQDELNVILYDQQGRKLLLKDGVVWKVSEDILLSIPIEELEEAEGKITVLYEDNNSGTVKQYEFSCCRK